MKFYVSGTEGSAAPQPRLTAISACVPAATPGRTVSSPGRGATKVRATENILAFVRSSGRVDWSQGK